MTEGKKRGLFYRSARLRRKMRQQGTQQQGQEQMGWQQYIPVELLIGFLIVFWYMVAFLYQLGYKIWYEIPLMYMDYSFTRLLEPAMYISVSVVVLIVLLCFIVKIKYSPRRYSVLLIINFICILFWISQTWTFQRVIYDLELHYRIRLIPFALLPEWVIISIIASFLILFSILFIIRFFSNVENGSVISIKSIPTTDKVLILVSSLIFLLFSTFLIGLYTASTKEIFLVFNKKDETIIDGKKIKFERKYVVLDYYDKYYIVAPLKKEDYEMHYGPEIELVKMEGDKESPFQVLNDPVQFQKNEKEDNQIRLYEYDNERPIFDFKTYERIIDEIDEDLQDVNNVNANDILEACVRVKEDTLGWLSSVPDLKTEEEYERIFYEQPYLEFGLQFSKTNPYRDNTNHQILPQKMKVPLDQPLQCQTWVAPKYGWYVLKVFIVNKKIEQLLKEGKIKISEFPYNIETSLHVIGHKVDE